MATNPLRVLFLCTRNAARSQVAEALLRHYSKGRAQVFSAGSDPATEIHPDARAVLEQHYAIDTSGLHPKSLNTFRDESFDYIITVCDRVAEICPTFPNDPEKIHWRFEDPSEVSDPEARHRAFQSVAAGIAGRLRIWMALPVIREHLDQN